MRVVILIVMLAGLAALCWRQYKTQRLYVWSISVLTVATLVTGTLEYQWRATNDRYARVAYELLTNKHPVGVSCERFSAELVSVSQYEGFVPYPDDGSLPPRALLMRTTCGALGNWLRSDKSTTKPEHVEALHVFVHEVMHLDGVYTEAEAECLAMQKTEQAARLFGAPEGNGQRMAAAYWRTVVPHMPDEYRGNCEPNGRGDLTPGDGVWR